MQINQFFRFEPRSQYRIWGGEKIMNILRKAFSSEKIGESWEISDVPGFESKLTKPYEDCATLRDLLEKYPNEILGTKVVEKFGTTFPLLIKFIDAKEPLSVQVHPDDEFAMMHHQSFGKSEMWYILDAEKNAKITSGFRKEIDLETYRSAIETNSLEALLNTWEVRKGDCILLPAGRVHAIGEGILLAEIQQNSDITYRIWDYNRIDKDGKRRELHHDLAEKVINFSDTASPILSHRDTTVEREQLANNPYFCTHLLRLEKATTKDYRHYDSFVVLIAIEGDTKLQTNDTSITLGFGETVLIPASFASTIEMIPLQAQSQVLEVFI